MAAPGEAEPDRLGQAGKRDGQSAERNAEGDADEKRDEVCFIEFLERVADGDGSFVEVGGCADDLDLVAKLQAQAGHRGHLQVSARDAGNGDAEAIVKIQFGHGLAKHRAVGHGDTAEGDAALG